MTGGTTIVIDGLIWFICALMICGLHAYYLWGWRRERRAQLAWWERYEAGELERHGEFLRVLCTNDPTTATNRAALRLVPHLLKEVEQMRAVYEAAKAWRPHFHVCETDCPCEDCKLARPIDTALALEAKQVEITQGAPDAR